MAATDIPAEDPEWTGLLSPLVYFGMALVYCNTCFRNHVWSVGICCTYYKVALARCNDLGVSTENYVQYLPLIQNELGNLDSDNMAARGDSLPKTPKREIIQKKFCMSPSDVLAVLKDSVE